MVTSRDVAKLAGVSQATVSRAMSSKENVRPATRAKVLAAMEELGYTRNAAATTMKTGLTDTIGVVVADIKNPFYPEILDSLTQVFDDAGKRVIVWNSDGLKNVAAIQAIKEGSIDGIVFTTIIEDFEPLKEALDQKYPIVLINRGDNNLVCDQVTSENIGGGGLVADYFLDQKRMRIAFIGGPEHVSTAREREEGFRRRLSERGRILDSVFLRRGEYTHRSGFALMRDLLDMKEQPDAVFCCNDVVAFGALDCARHYNVRIPEDMWIVGYDDVEMASWDSYSLSTVRQYSKQMVIEGARLLLQRIEDPSRPTESIRFPSSLILRKTSGPVRKNKTGNRAGKDGE
jgi:LacI family transcriptional regulator